MNKKYYRIIGLSGVICFLFGLGYLLVKREASFYVIANLLAGLGMMGVFAYYNLKEVSKLLVTSQQKGSYNVLLRTGLILGALLLVNLISNLVYFGKDLTRDKVSSISEQSRKIIENIKEPLEILVFSTDDGNDFEKYLLESYNFYNKRISYRFLDPEKSPQLAQEYGIVKTGQAAVKYKDSTLVVPGVTEQNVTNAIIKMTQSMKNYVYFVYGHGEHSVDDSFANQGYGQLLKELGGENYFTVKLKFEPPHYYIPNNCTILVVAGPREGYSSLETKAIREYLDNGGRAVFLLDPNVRSGLEGIIKEWGITLHDDCMLDVVFPSIAERATAAMSGRKASARPEFQVMVQEFPEHEITQDLKDKSVLMSVTRSMVVADTSTYKADLKVEPLAQTTVMGWRETSLDDLFKSGKVSSAVRTNRGPATVALLSTKGSADANSKLIVIGDSDFINNEYLHQLYNRDFFMNCLGYLSKQAALVSVRPRHLFASRLDYDPDTMSRIFSIAVLIIPQLFLMAGLAIWSLRK